jgi:hypothetical protein
MTLTNDNDINVDIKFSEHDTVTLADLQFLNNVIINKTKVLLPQA